MKKLSFLLLLLTITNCSAGSVVFLYGPASTGKTSLCNELLKLSDHWRLVSEDDIYYEQVAQGWKAEFPRCFDTIERAVDKRNMLHAVMRNQVLFRAEVSDDERIKAKDAIAFIQETLNRRSKTKEAEHPNSWRNRLRRQTAQTIMDYAATHHVIIDSWFLQKEHIEQASEKNDVVRVLTYCPFPEIVRRTLKRNVDALVNGEDIFTLRFFIQPLSSFTGLYDLSDTEDGSIDCIDRRELIRWLDIVRLCLHDSPDATGVSKTFTRGEFSIQAFEEYRKNLLDKCKSETVYIVPKIDFDVLVRTDQEGSVECAQRIIDFVNTRKN